VIICTSKIATKSFCQMPCVISKISNAIDSQYWYSI